MSTRHARRIFGGTTLPIEAGSSDEDFEPLYVNKNPSSAYKGLEVSSHSECGNESNDEFNAVKEAKNKTKKKKKYKKKKSKTKSEKMEQAFKNEDINLDDIDRAVMEVNSLLGEPPIVIVPEVKKEVVKELLSVQSKYLNYEYEDRRCFGLELPEDDPLKKVPHDYRKCTRAVIIPVQDGDYVAKVGISMSILHQEKNGAYFVYNHNRDYQTMHKKYLLMFKGHILQPLEMLQNDMNIEGLLTYTDYLFEVEEYATANSILKLIISTLQYKSHESFILTNIYNRLEYKYAENRVFHIAVMKYIYMLTTKALHRTALEVAKLLINLDNTDPLSVMLIIDTLAIRAKEYNWVIKFVDFRTEFHNEDFYFSFLFTSALAHYHITKKSKSEDYKKADTLLQTAIANELLVAAKILKAISYTPDPQLANHFILSPKFQYDFGVAYAVNIAMDFQVKMIFPKFREPPVLKWFLRNAIEVVQKYDADDDFKKIVQTKAKERALFKSCPNSIRRHLAVVQSMTKYLVDWEMPSKPRIQTWNPVPPENNINRYNYGVEEPHPSRNLSNGSYRNIMTDFVYSIAPHYNPGILEDDE